MALTTTTKFVMADHLYAALELSPTVEDFRKEFDQDKLNADHPAYDEEYEAKFYSELERLYFRLAVEALWPTKSAALLVMYDAGTQ